MIQAFIEMPIEKQTWLVLSVGWVMLATSAAIREKTPPGECRNWARAMGVVGVLLMSLQTIHTTMIAEELNTELMVRRGTHDVERTEAVATQIADPVRVVAVASEYTSSVGGQTVSIVQYTDGRFGRVCVGGDGGAGSMPVGRRRENRVGHTASKRIGGTASGNGTGFLAFDGTDGLSNAEHVEQF